MSPAGRLRERIALDVPSQVPNGSGGRVMGWAEAHACAAEFLFDRGGEAVEGGGLTGTARFKVKIRACQAIKDMGPTWRLRDTRRGLAFNIRWVDVVTQRGWIFLGVEQGVAI